MQRGMNGFGGARDPGEEMGDTEHDALGHFADAGASIERATACFGFLRSVPILFEIDDTTLWDLAHSAQEHEFAPGTRVVAQGDDEDDANRQFYVIRSGSADVMRRDRSGLERIVARLSVGSYFGELGLLTNQSRNATVRVHGTKPLRTYAFDALAFHQRIAEHVLVFRILRERQRQLMPGRASRGRLRIKDLDLFRGLPQHDLEFVLQRAEHRWYPERAPIVRQGDDGDRFYILLEGSASVTRDQEHIADLAAGDFFGETALLLDAPRNATVQASAHTLTWSITRAAFQRLVGSYLLANPQTHEEILRRMHAGTAPDQ